jgi:hypothetical protein
MMRGDVLPMVGVLQLLLNRSGAKLGVDGIFGPHTESAVRAFQQRSKLKQDGIVGEHTWEALTAGVDLPIADSIDVWDPTFLKEDATYIRQVGGDPIILGGMCNGVEQAVTEILRNSSNVFLLRFHGHGAPGVGSSGTGHGELDPDMKERSDIWDDPTLLATLARLSSVFGPYGCVEFIQCQTGRGPKGHLLLAHLATRLNVPVTGAVNDQPFSRAASFRLFGPTVTVAPKGSLRDWCRTLPPISA